MASRVRVPPACPLRLLVPSRLAGSEPPAQGCCFLAWLHCAPAASTPLGTAVVPLAACMVHAALLPRSLLVPHLCLRLLPRLWPGRFPFCLADLHLFTVYDGHGELGTECAQFVRDRVRPGAWQSRAAAD